MSDPRSGRVTRDLVTAATVSYLTNSAFGAAVAAGVIDNSRIRWVHHALFVATSSLTVVALAASAVEHRRSGLALLPAVGPLAVLPYLSGSMKRHATVAGFAAPAYGTALAMVWRRR